MASSLLPTPTGDSIKNPSASDPRQFPTPWLDYTSTSVPDNHELVMWWAQYLWLTDGNFRTAMERVAAHFITSIEFPDLEPDEESQWRELFTNYLNYQAEMTAVGQDYLCYGNVVLTMYLPFKRFVRCRNCGIEQPLSEVDYQLEYSPQKPYLRWHRKSSCPKCGDRQTYKVFDRRDPDLSRIRINRHDPSDIELAQNRFSGRKEIYWRIPQEDKRNYLSLARIHIDETPIEVLEAVAANGKVRFDEDMVLHHAETIVSGVKTYGWGVPRSISNFRTAWLQQLTNKMDQAVAIDYTLAPRIISPDSTTGGEDPMVSQGMEKFVQNMRGIIASHRQSPTSYHVAPYPVKYQMIGGEGQALLPHEKLKFRQQEYLNQLGVPLEYHQMNLSTQAAPMALRLFEAYWQSIPVLYNRVLDWVVKTVGRAFGLDQTKVLMQKTTIADDMERKAVLLQLMSSNQLSPQTALQPFGIDAHEEVKKVLSHQEYVARTQAEYDEKAMQQEEMGVLKGTATHPTPSTMQQDPAMAGGAPMDPMAAAGAGQMMSGGMPTGGMPGAQSQTPQSLQALSEQADMIAQQLVSMDDYTRKQELKALREGNKDLHDLVTQRMEDIRSQARSAGGQMLLQQGQAPM